MLIKRNFVVFFTSIAFIILIFICCSSSFNSSSSLSAIKYNFSQENDINTITFKKLNGTQTIIKISNKDDVTYTLSYSINTTKGKIKLYLVDSNDNIISEYDDKSQELSINTKSISDIFVKISAKNASGNIQYQISPNDNTVTLSKNLFN